MDAKTQDDARSGMDTLRLSKDHLMDHQYIPLRPLMPLMGIDGTGAQQ
jgi:hypothetical protein